MGLAVLGLITLAEILLVKQVDDWLVAGREREAFELDMVIGALGRFYAQAWVATAIMFLAWVARCSANTRALNAQPRAYEPTAAVVSYLIPLVNFVLPCIVMNQLARANDPRSMPNRSGAAPAPRHLPVIFAWWLAWMGSLFLPALGDFTPAPSLLSLTALVLAIAVVLSIQRRQNQCFARHCAAA